ncbi:Hypothetical predicted protein [Pelobates cultripes]|uniref:Uncharacterized protein n=1 Tax=Pelobates cultripes TaxID=61616 RepID=A0AAD1RLT7_PELCU|nr:Hypothetical predicted protein [Pelobates cultripes]
MAADRHSSKLEPQKPALKLHGSKAGDIYTSRQRIVPASFQYHTRGQQCTGSTETETPGLPASINQRHVSKTWQPTNTQKSQDRDAYAHEE